MNRRTFLFALAGAAAASGPALSRAGAREDDPISGRWGSDSQALLDLKYDGKRAVTGKTYWRGGNQTPVEAAIERGTFDAKTGALKLQGTTKRPDNGQPATYVIEGTLADHKLAGTFAVGDQKGSFTFTKLKD
jgi:hypothetical protein